MKKFNFKKPDFSKVKEKLKDIRQDKKKLAIWITSGAAIIALIICAVIFVPGAMKGNSTSISDTASSNKVTTTTKKDSTKTDKRDSKAAASAKPSASAASTSSPETADSKDNAEVAASDKDSNTSSNSGSAAGSGNSGTSSNSNNSGTTISQGAKPAGSASGSKTSNSSGNSSKSQTCKTVHHDATGHYENTTTQQWVQDSAAWDETVVDQAAYDEPIYSWDAILHCKACGYETYDALDMITHCANEGSTYESRAFKVQTGTQHHDAVTHVVHHDATGHYEPVVTGQQWVQDSAAWDEKVCN